MGNPMIYKKLNLRTELEYAVQRANDAMGNIAQDEISEEYAEVFLGRIHEIIERYYLYRHDAESILDFLDKAKPDDFLIGLNGKEFDMEKYSRSIELIKIKVCNIYISEKRKRRHNIISLLISFASLVVAIIAILVGATSGGCSK